MGKIDDPWEASREAWPPKRENAPADTALTLAGLLGPAIEIATNVLERFRATNREQRIEYFLQAMDLKFKEIDKKFASKGEDISKIKEKIAASEFHEAAQVAAEEALRAVSIQKVDQFATILVGSLTPNQWANPHEDIGTMIRDIAQLSSQDLKVLGILRKVHSAAIAMTPNLYEPDAFSRETTTLNTAIGVNGFHRDDFPEVCERLRGSGLREKVPRNASHMWPPEYCYRPTRRGLAVLEYLETVPAGAGASAEQTK